MCGPASGRFGSGVLHVAARVLAGLPVVMPAVVGVVRGLAVFTVLRAAAVLGGHGSLVL
jgi:hypothetical protein